MKLGKWLDLKDLPPPRIPVTNEGLQGFRILNMLCHPGGRSKLDVWSWENRLTNHIQGDLTSAIWDHEIQKFGNLMFPDFFLPNI